MKLFEVAQSNTKFKALFIAGPPATGKSFIHDHIQFPPHSYLNTDNLRHEEARRLHVDLNDLNAEQHIFKGVLDQATVFLFNNTLVGEPLIIETTADLKHNFFKRVKTLQSLGYEIGLIYTHTTKDQSVEQERKRREIEGRAVDPSFIEKVYEDMPTRLAEIADLLGNENVLYVPRENIQYTKDQQMKIQQFARNFFSTPTTNPKGKRLAHEMSSNPNATIIALDNENVYQLYNLLLGWFDK